MTRAFRLGLTGSIGMGKSTAAAMFAEAGCAVWDADASVHRLYAPGGGAVPEIARLRPEAVGPQGVSRAALKDWIATEPGALARIEAVVHPLVAADRAAFLDTAAAPVAVCDIPLLFEGGLEREFDATGVVTAPPKVQHARVLARPGMTEAHFAAILAKQMPDAEKRARADYLIPSETLETARAAVRHILDDIGSRHA